jgi:hypothetical protein
VLRHHDATAVHHCRGQKASSLVLVSIGLSSFKKEIGHSYNSSSPIETTFGSVRQQTLI